MPFKSQAQRRKFYAMASRGEMNPKTVRKWETETVGPLPERLSKTSMIMDAFADELEKTARVGFLARPSAGKMGRAALLGLGAGGIGVAAATPLAGRDAYMQGLGGDALRTSAEGYRTRADEMEVVLDSIRDVKGAILSSGVVPKDAWILQMMRDQGANIGRIGVGNRLAVSTALRSAQAADVRRLNLLTPYVHSSRDEE